MHIKINSYYSDGATWEGEVPTMTLEGLFRFFNRVEPEDDERLADMGYHLPSLTCNDIVWAEGFAHMCAPSGWRRMPDLDLVQIPA